MTKWPLPLTRFLLTTLVVLAMALGLSGCKAGHEELADFCEELADLSKDPGECSEFAGKIEALTDENRALIQSLPDLDPPEEEKAQWRAAMATCYETYVAISTGPCGESPKVEAAIEAFGR